MTLKFSLAIATTVLGLVVTDASATDVSNAKGTLILQGEGQPVSLALTHAYFVTGPDDFDDSKISRVVVFTGSDVKSAIEACENLSCAKYAADQGMWLEITDEPTMRWHGKAGSMQQSGMPERKSLDLTMETAERLSGTLTLSNIRDGSGEPASFTFDSALIKTFP